MRLIPTSRPASTLDRLQGLYSLCAVLYLLTLVGAPRAAVAESSRPAPPAQAPTTAASPAPGVQAPATLPNPARVATLLRADGSLITWYVDRPSAKSYPLVAILQGSECLPVAPKYVELRAALVAHGIGVLRIEKRGLTAETATCPDEYLRENTIPNRILDCLEVIAALRQKPDGWNGRLVIVGGSEGGLVGALLAPLVPEARALVMLVSGPDSLEEIVPWSIAPQLRAQGTPEAKIASQLLEVREQFARMTADPSPYKEWFSDGKSSRNTWKWWASAARLRPQVALERLDIPVLILQGDDDPITPLRSIQQLDARMRELGKTRFAWRRYPRTQHDLTAPLAANPILRDALDFVYRQAGTGHER